MTQVKITEKLETPVCENYDVVVCGGGISGLAAAVSAARMGVSVLLIEKNVILGGLATIGLVSWYEPICNGKGEQVMYGMAEELLSLSIKYGFNTLDDYWQGKQDEKEPKKRYATFFSPTMFAMALDEWLLDSGVELLLDSVVVSVVMEDQICKGVIVENKSGRSFYPAKMVIDTTGDADVLSRAGVPCIYGKNYLTYIAYKTDIEKCTKAIESKNIFNSRKWTTVGSDLWGKGHPDSYPMYSGVDAREVTDFVVTGRRMLFNKIKDEPGFERDITILPSMAQFRTTRRICGEYELVENDMGKHFEDSIGVASDFFKPGNIYELPFRILYNKEYENILTAGRSVSASGWAWDVTRVIPVAAATGQAAGTAAGLCVRDSVLLNGLNISVLQEHLLSSGVRIYMK